MSNLDLKLDDFPYSNPGFGRKIAVVAVGSPGSRIARQLSKESRLLEHYVYVSCDEQDLAGISKGERVLIDVSGYAQPSPYSVRGQTAPKLPELKRLFSDSWIVFIIAGLGGVTGSGLAPLIAKEASACGAVTVAVLVMPYNFEREKHFAAGTALKQVRKYASGVILIDNDELVDSRKPLVDEYSHINQRIALALSRLLGNAEPHEFALGLNNLVRFVKTKSYSVLCIDDCRGNLADHKQAVLNAANHFGNIVDSSQAARSIVHLCTDKSVTMNEMAAAIGGLSSILGNGTLQIEYGLSANCPAGTSTAVIMAAGFPTTKFDEYDPIDAALGQKGFNLEEDLETCSGFEYLLPQAEREYAST